MADLILQQGIDAGYAWPILDGDQPADLTGWDFLGPLAPYAKAIVALLAPGLLIIAAVLTQGRAPTVAEWLTALGTALATALAVYAVPNRTL